MVTENTQLSATDDARLLSKEESQFLQKLLKTEGLNLPVADRATLRVVAGLQDKIDFIVASHGA